MTGPVVIRPEEPADRDAIFAVNRAAFGRDAEAALVDRLRADGGLVLSLVAVDGEELVGHVAVSHLDVRAGRAAVLAPVAVVPARQRRGIAAALIREGLAPRADKWIHLSASNDAPLKTKSIGWIPTGEATLGAEALARLAEEGQDLVLVLGDPAYYSRFGFTAEAVEPLETPYDGPGQQALALTGRGRCMAGGVRYASAFAEFG